MCAQYHCMYQQEKGTFKYSKKKIHPFLFPMIVIPNNTKKEDLIMINNKNERGKKNKNGMAYNDNI